MKCILFKYVAAHQTPIMPAREETTIVKPRGFDHQIWKV